MLVVNTFKWVVGIFICILLSGCSSEFDQFKSAYEKGAYDLALDYAVKAYQDAGTKDQVVAFFEKNEERVFTNILNKGIQLEQTVTDPDQWVVFWEKSFQLAALVIKYNLPSDRVLEFKNTVSKHLDAARFNVCQQLNEASIQAFKSKQYRQVVQLIAKIKAFEAHFLGMDERYATAYELATRKLSILPVEVKRNGENSMGDALSTWEALDVNDISGKMTKEIRAQIEKNKTFFIQLIDASHPSIDLKSKINIQAELEIEVEDSYNTPLYDETIVDTFSYSYPEGGILAWRTASFTYDIYSVFYRITLHTKTQIIDAETQEVLKTIDAKETVREDARFRQKAKEFPLHAVQVEMPDSYLTYPTAPQEVDVERILTEAIEKMATRLSQDVLNEIDK